MLRRSILELSSRQSVRRNLTRITTQTPLYLSYSRQYSVASDKHASQGSGSSGKPPEAGNSLSKVIIGTVALGAAFMAAYQWNSLEERRKSLESAKIGTKDAVDLPKSINDLQEDKQLQEKNAVPSVQDSNVSSTDASTEDSIGISDSSHLDDLNRKAEGTQFQVEDKTDLTPGQEDIPTVSMTSDVESKTSGTSVEEMPDMKNTELNSGIEQEKVESRPVREQVNAIPTENEMKSTSPQLQTAKDILEDAVVNGVEQQSSLLDEYYLRDKAEPTISTLSDKHKELKDLVGAIEDSNDVYISKDGKLVLDFLEAIHAAEKRQAELDARVFAEEKRKIKERYEKELKDARATQLMYAEEAAILDKELNKERVKAAAALKSLQEELQGKLKMELEQKEAEVESELKQMQELAKAELAAAIASEKASQIEKMAEANLHINALCLAFYARSEEARQSHSLHKLALGALTLEDVLSKGLPIQKEIEALHVSVEGIDKDPLVELVLSSLPEETRDYGTDTILQLRHKFDALKGMLRHFSLIPPGGGGVLAHSLAHIASWLKVREADQSGDGIESLINRVESLLAEGKLAEAADTLENGVKGTQAAEVIGEWLKQARNRAITEQALTLLQSYATSISLS